MNLFHIILESMHYTADFLAALSALDLSPPGPLVVGRENVPSLEGSCTKIKSATNCLVSLCEERLGAEGEAQAVEILHEVNQEMGEGLMLAAWLDPHDTDSRERLSRLVCAFIYSSDFDYPEC